MNPADALSKARKTVRVGPPLILTLAVVAALLLLERAPDSAPAAPWEVVVQEEHAPMADIVPSPVEGFGPAQMPTGDGGQ